VGSPGSADLPSARVPLPDGLTDVVRAEVERLPWEHQIPLLEAFLVGRRGRALHTVSDDAGLQLVWGADHGEVAFVVVAPAGRNVRVRVNGLHYGVPSGPADLRHGGASLPLARYGPSGAWIAGPHEPEAGPTLDELLAATAAIRAGATVRTATRELVPWLWTPAADAKLGGRGGS